MNDETLIIIISAPSGSGKTTVVERLLAELPRVKRSISCTTRPPRQGEQEGRDYFFVSEGDFRRKIENGEFLEWEETFGNFYGTPLEQFTGAMENGQDLILSIDVKGARQVKEKFPGAISVFIMPPSTEELEARLRKRNTDRKDQVDLRLKEARRELEAADEYDYLVVNDDLDGAVTELKSVLEAERQKRQENAKKDKE